MEAENQQVLKPEQKAMFSKAIAKNSDELKQRMNELNETQQYAMFQMMIGKNVYLSGDAGTGKSHLINLFNDWCEEGKRKLLKTAPTGKASVNIGGVTTHSLFGLPLRVEETVQPLTALKNKVESTLVNADRIVIDEVSMLRMDNFERCMKSVQLANEKKFKKISRRLQQGENVKYRNIQVILVGDFGQLPPVVTDKDRPVLNQHYGKNVGDAFCFQSPVWNEMGFETIRLTEIVRQKDKEFSEALTACKHGDVSCINYFNQNFKSTPNEDAVWLYGKNASALAKNKECLAKLTTPLREFYVEYEGDASSQDGLAEDIQLKEGCRVLITANDTGKGSTAYEEDNDKNRTMRYCNGSTGTVVGIFNDHLDIIVDETQEKVSIEKTVYEKKDYRTSKVSSFENVPVLDEAGKPKLDSTGKPVTKSTLVDKDVTELVTVGKAKQFPVKLGYAITVHKSQGMTLDKVNFKPEIFANGQFYVAMSRCKDIHNLYCEGRATEKMVKTSPEFIRFANNPNNYSFFSDADKQKMENKANGIDENQLSFNSVPNSTPAQSNDEIPAFSGSTGFTRFGAKAKAIQQKTTPPPVPKQEEQKAEEEQKNAYPKNGNEGYTGTRSEITYQQKDDMLNHFLSQVSAFETDNNKMIDVSQLASVINSDKTFAKRLADVIYDEMLINRKTMEENGLENTSINTDVEPNIYVPF